MYPPSLFPYTRLPIILDLIMGDEEEAHRLAMLEYHKNYDDSNTEIITALAAEADEETKQIILNYNVNKIHKDFTDEIKAAYSPEALLKAATFLRVKPRTKHPTTIAKTIIVGIQNYLHEKCEACSEYYAVEYHAKPTLICHNCGQGCHEQCYSVCKKLPGIEWSCSSCNTTNYPNAAKHDLEETTTTPREEQEAEEKKEVEESNSGDSEDKDKEEHPTSPERKREKSTNVCPNYKWGPCPSFSTCSYDHPPRCWSWLQHGKCPFKKKCRYDHPPLCKFSIWEKKCKDRTCKFFHVKGTTRDPEEQNENQHSENNHQRPVQQGYNNNTRIPNPAIQARSYHQRAPHARNATNQHSDDASQGSISFLVQMMKELKNEITNINNKINTQETTQTYYNQANYEHQW